LVGSSTATLVSTASTVYPQLHWYQDPCFPTHSRLKYSIPSTTLLDTPSFGCFGTERCILITHWANESVPPFVAGSARGKSLSSVRTDGGNIIFCFLLSLSFPSAADHLPLIFAVNLSGSALPFVPLTHSFGGFFRAGDSDTCNLRILRGTSESSSAAVPVPVYRSQEFDHQHSASSVVCRSSLSSSIHPLIILLHLHLVLLFGLVWPCLI